MPILKKPESGTICPKLFIEILAFDTTYWN
jgi:hypothetical protein